VHDRRHAVVTRSTWHTPSAALNPASRAVLLASGVPDDTLTVPVSSSIVTKVTPLAVDGRAGSDDASRADALLIARLANAGGVR